MTKTKIITADEFRLLSPFNRGYTVYMCGTCNDQPNVPDEQNPYIPNTPAYKRWEEGAMLAVREAQESEE